MVGLAEKRSLTVGFLCLGNTEFFKSETGEAQQIITSSLRDGSVVLKRTILEIFHDYFAIEEHKAESLEGIKKDDVDLSNDIGVLTGTATSVATDECHFSNYRSNRRASFFLAGNFLGDIMECSLSDSEPLAITATEVFDFIARGGLAAPNDVTCIFNFINARFSRRWLHSKRARFQECVI